MREILFRGKRADNGEWVYGYLSKTRGLDYKLHPCIDYEYRGVMLSCVVVPETIGQYTGLKDKNGKKIFDGDIIRVRYEEELDSVFGTPDVRVYYEHFEVFFSEKYHCWYARHAYDRDDDYWLYEFDEDCEVIGNIHDNPELLKGGTT